MLEDFVGFALPDNVRLLPHASGYAIRGTSYSTILHDMGNLMGRFEEMGRFVSLLAIGFGDLGDSGVAGAPELEGWMFVER